MKKILAIAIAAISLASCKDVNNSGRRPYVVNLRAKVLESNTITYVRLPVDKFDIYRDKDTVWVNLQNHTIDDTCTTAMQCVIYKKDSLNL